MTTDFKLPDLGENIESGDVVTVLVTEGDVIKKDDPVLEIETDKATIEVPSSIEGTITAIHVKAGDTITVGQLILSADNGTGQPSVSAVAVVEAPPAAAAEPISPPQADPIQAAPVATVPILVDFTLPDLGENIDAGDIVSILMAVGDSVVKDQGVLELETDKATVEVPSPATGTVKAIHVKPGDSVAVGQLVFTVEAVSDQVEVKPASPPPSPQAPAPEAVAKAARAPVSPSTDAPERQLPVVDTPPAGEKRLVPAAPNVRRMARQIGVDLSQVTGTGVDGRISLDDVKFQAKETLTGLREGRAVPSGPPAPAVLLPDFSKWGEIETQPMSNIRKATAKHMHQAWSTIPHVTQFDKADIAELEQLRKRFSQAVENAGGKLTITAILLKVVAAALKAFPQFNASVDMVNQEIIYKNYYHVGVAVDTERGLLVPVIRDVDRKNIQELAIELGEVAERARDRKLGLEDMQGGTFTITNLGGIGGTNFTPIVNPPEVAILGVARGGVEPVYKDGQFEPRLMLPLALSYDHRLIDGADGARFLRWLVTALEDPFMMALQGW